MTVYIVYYTTMGGDQSICFVTSLEQKAIDFCRGHQCYSYDIWAVT